MFTPSDLRFPLLILKAITKKQVWVAGYTKKDGTPVAAHYATVNVQLDHDHEKVASGNGSGPQKEAWKHLSKQEAHRKLSVEEQAHNIAHLATEIQADKTNAAQVTFFKQSILDGKKPRPADIRAFQNAPRERKLSAAYAIIDAGKEMDLDNLIGDIKPGDWSVTDGAVFEKQETGEWREIERRVKSKKPPKPKASKHFDPEHDDLLAAIAKLGGLSREDAKAQGIDPAEFNRRGYSFKRVFTHNGMSFDDMAHNLLGPEGYPAADANELLDSLSTALGGQKVYTPNGYMNAMDAAHSEDYDPIPDDYLGDYDGSRYAMGEYAEAWTPVSDAAFEMATDHAQGDNNETNRETAETGGVVQGGGGQWQSGGDSDAAATAGGDGQGQSQQGGGADAGVEKWATSNEGVVLGSDGKPKTFYHGGADVSSGDLKPLTFFSDDKSVADDYLKFGTQSGDGRVHEVNLVLRNPASDNDVAAAAKKVGIWNEHENPHQYLTEEVYGDSAHAVAKELARQGFDGARVLDMPASGGDPITSFTVFSSGQIKDVNPITKSLLIFNPTLFKAIKSAG